MADASGTDPPRERVYRMSRSSSRGAAAAARIGALLAVVAAGAAPGDLTSPPTAWSNFGIWFPFTFNGVPMRDFESTGGCVDPTKGPAAFTAEVDLASGGAPYNVANCNPAVAGGTCCGTETTGFWSYFNGGADTNVANDWYAVRMRVNGDPRAPGLNCLSNSHWNFLLDIGDNDGFKEIWIDLWGNENRIRLLYEDNGSQFVSNDNTVPPATDTVINEFTACAVATVGVTCGSGQNVRTCTNSRSRVCGVTSLANDTGSCTTTTNATGEWYVDIQIAVDELRDSTGSFGPPATGGNPLFTSFPPVVSWFLSTSDSSTDPVQKDYISTCVAASGPCGFTAPTPVTLSYFRAERLGGGVAFDWSTASETGNVGFDLFVEGKGGWRKVTKQPVASTSPFSLERTDYRLELAGLDGERFAIEDVDLAGNRRRHGPFEIETSYGTRRAVQRVDWTAIRREHEAKAAARERAARRAPVAAPRGDALTPPATASADLLVERDGVYRARHADLLAAGVDLTGVAASSLALTLDGRPVPIRVLGPAKFGPTSAIEFLGVAAAGPYTRTNVYRLRAHAADARRMLGAATGGGTATAPVTRHLETRVVDEDLAWTFASPDAADPWYRDWVVAFAGSPVTRELTFEVDRLAAGKASLLLELWGMTDWASGPDHHVLVALNGTPVADRRFDGLTTLALDLEIPAGLLVEGANRITLTLPVDAGVDFEVVAVDRFGARYPRRLVAVDGELAFSGTAAAYAVDGFAAGPVLAYQKHGDSVRFLGTARVRPSGEGVQATFAAEPGTSSDIVVAQASAIRTPAVRPSRRAPQLRTGQADYLIIAHPDFVEGLDPLVDARRADGYSVRVADVEDVYGEFGHGRFGPEAIRGFIRHAAAELGTEMVLLVGADTYDYFDRTGAGSISFVPTLYDSIGPIVRLAPVDSLYGDLDDDRVPELAIGRFPVRNSAELAAMVAKTLAYPTAGHAGRAVVAADRGEVSNDFVQVSEQTLESLPGGWQVERAYVDELGIDGAHDLLVGALEAGVAFAQYTGHSSSDLWSFAGLFDRDDAAALTNAGRPAVVSQLGCWNAFYVTPSATTLAEALLTSGDRGAAAVLGPSALSSTISNLWLARALNRELFEQGLALGPALVAAKREVAQTRPWMHDVVRGFTLLGDPALRPAP